MEIAEPTPFPKRVLSGALFVTGALALAAKLLELIGRYLDRQVTPPVSSPPPRSTAGSIEPQGIDDDVIGQFLPAYVAHLSEDVCRLQSLLENGDLKALADALHQVKGTSGLYGFAPIMEAAAQAEHSALREAPLASIQNQMRTVIDLIRQVKGYDQKKRSCCTSRGG